MVAATSPHVLALARGSQARLEVVGIATRLLEGVLVAGGWGSALVQLPDGRWRDLVSGRVVAAGREGTPVAQLLDTGPVALLVRAESR
jgi:(1->4)-alpha-D-glucan 1-alpha-D-glucosylmutase